MIGLQHIAIAAAAAVALVCTATGAAATPLVLDLAATVEAGHLTVDSTPIAGGTLIGFSATFDPASFTSYKGYPGTSLYTASSETVTIGGATYGIAVPLAVALFDPHNLAGTTSHNYAAGLIDTATVNFAYGLFNTATPAFTVPVKGPEVFSNPVALLAQLTVTTTDGHTIALYDTYTPSSLTASVVAPPPAVATPEPSSLVLLASGLIGGIAVRRRRG